MRRYTNVLSISSAARPSSIIRANPALGVRYRSDFPRRLAFAFDIDGVLKQGPNVLPQAKRALNKLAGENPWKQPIPYLLITNGGGHPDDERRRMLSSELGQELTANQLVQSHTPMQAYAMQYADKHVLVVGGKGDECRRVAHSYGLKNAWIPQDIIAASPSVWPKTTLTPSDLSIVKRADFASIRFAAIFCMHDSHDWGRDATIINELIESDGGVLGTKGKAGEGFMPLIFSNPDLEWKSDYVLPRYGQGAFRLAIEAIYKATTGKDLRYTQYGKPHTNTYAFAEAMLQAHLKETRGEILDRKGMSVYMIGDNPESDIAGANAHGWSSCLLRTGVYAGGTPRHEPTIICDDVEAAVEWAIEREVEQARRENALE